MLRKLGIGLGIIGLIFVILIAIAWTPDIPEDELRAKYAYGASAFVTLPSGTEAHYRDEGNRDAAAIILIHGSNASLHTWEAWVNDLKESHRVITLDLPGHGLTGPTPPDDYSMKGMTTFLEEFTGALSVSEFILGGNSMGGGISLAYTLNHPDQVKALILVDSAGVRIPASEGAKTDRPIVFRIANKWYASWFLENITPRSLSEEGLKKSFSDHSLIDDAMINRYWELARLPGGRAATLKRFASYADANNTPLDYSQITAPTLILWGDEDKLIPVKAGEILSDTISGSKLIIYKGVGHIPMEEVAARSVSDVQDFIGALNY
jgi:pimeloyl-ACP methyl ester carboxylesterase